MSNSCFDMFTTRPIKFVFPERGGPTKIKLLKLSNEVYKNLICFS